VSASARGDEDLILTFNNTIYRQEERMETYIEILLVALPALFVGFMVALGFYIVKQWEKVAVLRFGKIIKIASTGINYRIPIVDSLYRIDMRMQTIDLRGQSAITKDSISVGLDAVVFMKVEDPEKVILNVVNYIEAVTKYAQTSMRNIVGQYKLDELLSSRDKVAASLKSIIDELAQQWGIDIARTELQEINLPQNMQRAFAVQAESERESKAIIIKSAAELEASTNLQKAAANLADNNALQLRILETIKQVSKDQSNTIIFALPTETLKSIGAGGLAAMASINSSDARKRAQSKREQTQETEANEA
jgi:regulator of protease activity HflC (stomatin/prohibitin superfamily)